MMRFWAILSFSVVVIQAVPDVKIPSDRLLSVADEVNAKQTTWTAGNNFNYERGNLLDLSHTVGAILEHDDYKPRSIDSVPIECKENDLPTHFDAREHWKNCSGTLSHVYDQGNCRSCWAVSVASAFTDRLCIKSKGEHTELRSSQHLLSCSKKHGCSAGGNPLKAWKYLVEEGETTGGDYNSKKGCQPYLIAPCAHYVNNTDLEKCSDRSVVKTPKCNLHCRHENHGIKYNEDRVRATSAHVIHPCEAQNDIMKRGPIVAAFAVYEDFLTYKSGVYQHVSGKLIGYHAIRVVGWGIEKGVPYWLVINSWNKSWGDNGTCKILRGKNEVEFEEYFTAGDV